MPLRAFRNLFGTNSVMKLLTLVLLKSSSVLLWQIKSQQLLTSTCPDKETITDVGNQNNIKSMIRAVKIILTEFVVNIQKRSTLRALTIKMKNCDNNLTKKTVICNGCLVA